MAVDSALTAAVAARNGQPVDEDWLEQALAEAMAYVRLLAPCKRSTWVGYSDLPADVQSVVIASLARAADNPRGIKQETIGEYSYTLVSGANSETGPFNRAEARIITGNSGCGGQLTSVTMTLPPLRVLGTPDLDVPYEDE